MKHFCSRHYTNKHLPTICTTLTLTAVTQLWSTSLLAADTEQSVQPWDIGLTVGVVQSPFIGGKETLTISPTRLKHGGLRLNGFAWPVYQRPEFNFYLGIGLDEWDNERDDSAELADMNELERAVNIRAGIATELADGWLTAEIGKDLAGAHEGTQAKLRYTNSIGTDAHEIRPYLELQWLSAELTDYYVGVDSNEVTANRAQYEAASDLALKAGVDYRHRLSESLTLLGGLYLTHYGEEISDSPIVAEDLIWGANVGVAYRWQ